MTASRSLTLSKARDVYEEAIQTVLTVRDFGEVFDAYAQVHPVFSCVELY